MHPEKFIDLIGKHLLSSIADGTALKEPWTLTLFLIVSYADLKKYRFHYWAAYPTPFNLPELYYESVPQKIIDVYSNDAIEKFRDNFNNLDCRLKCFFTIFLTKDNNLNIKSLHDGVGYLNSNTKDSEATVEKIYFAFYDPCDSVEPGWPLRNLLCLLFWYCPDFAFDQTINIVSIRGKDLKSSVIFKMKAKKGLDKEIVRKGISEGRLVGWETNANGKMGPNIDDLSESMDPVR